MIIKRKINYKRFSKKRLIGEIQGRNTRKIQGEIQGEKNTRSRRKKYKIKEKIQDQGEIQGEN